MAELPRLPATSDAALTVYMSAFLRDTLKRYVEDVLNIYEGTGAPTMARPDGSLYRRRDTGELYVREGGAWVAK